MITIDLGKEDVLILYELLLAEMLKVQSKARGKISDEQKEINQKRFKRVSGIANKLNSKNKRL